MSDLISRSELLNAFNNTGIQITFDLPVEEILGEDVDIDDFSILVQDAIQAYKKMVIDTIKNQPTAYDIDKVVEELEEVHKKFCNSVTCGGESMCRYCEEYTMFKKNIEIVKQGYVTDDVCEWHCDEYGRWHTECNYLADNDPLEYIYCPYCGKKIKVVE